MLHFIKIYLKKRATAKNTSPTGRLAVNTQTAHVVALYMNLVPENGKRTVLDLRKNKGNDYHLRTGFVGTSYLCRVLLSMEVMIFHIDLQILIIQAGCIPLRWAQQQYGKDEFHTT